MGISLQGWYALAMPARLCAAVFETFLPQPVKSPGV